jgi:signal recognition particle GTPase
MALVLSASPHVQHHQQGDRHWQQLVKSLTDQIKAGFAEYELKMGSIQTIMAGSGESLETVNQKLKQLNEYSDKTIYSFADMTSTLVSHKSRSQS